MGGTVEEQQGVMPSGVGISTCVPIQINMDVGESFSEPILLKGRKIVCLHAPTTLSATDIDMQGTNFSSKTTTGGTSFQDGFLIPEDADFNDLYDQNNSQVNIVGTTGDRIWSCPDAGWPLWLRLNLSAAQTTTFYLVVKG